MTKYDKSKEFIFNRSKQQDKIFMSLVPSDVKNILDIGSGRFFLSKLNFFKYKDYASVDIKNADIIQDLNINKKIKLKENSYDLVVLSNILEHLVDPISICIEANRISRKYILIGLPNEFPLDKRISILFGFYYGGFYEFGHKHSLSINFIEEFVKKYWGDYEKRDYLFKFFGEKYIPLFIKNFLKDKFPNLFASEVYYLIKKTDRINKLVKDSEKYKMGDFIIGGVSVGY